ncbi:MAG: hypothetical protein KBT12_03885 [Bacteroidales bacterium]|nr:hypothetical protein [Candidatus Physcousia equi]
MYQEAEYTGDDSPYRSSAMRFAYHVDGKSLSPYLVSIGNNILQKAKGDAHYRSYLQSALNFEKIKNKNATQFEKFETTVSEARRALSAQTSNEDHTAAISKLKRSLNTLPVYNDAEFKDCWMRIYQLSHRGILQHYMYSNAEYTSLSKTDKALVYGYILKKDMDECDLLASAKANSDKENLSGITREVRHEIARHESILQKIEKQRKEEEERQRQKRLAEERARQERIQREQAQKRWNDDSWLDGKWNLVTQLGVTTIYIDTDRQTVKQYTKLFSSNPFQPAHLDYSGRYSISNGTANGVNCKIISFDITQIIAYPDNGKLMDQGGYYFQRR